MAKKHAAHKHMKDAMESMKMAHKAMKMDKVGSPKEELKMAKAGDKKGNSMKKTNKPNGSKK